MSLQEVPGGGEWAQTIHEGEQEETERVFSVTCRGRSQNPVLGKETWRQPTED